VDNQRGGSIQKKVEDLLEKIIIYQKICPISIRHPELRKCVISPQTSLIYRIHEDDIIELVAFIDNRRKEKY